MRPFAPQPREPLKCVKLMRFMKRSSPRTRLTEKRSSPCSGTPQTREEGRGGTPLNLKAGRGAQSTSQPPVQTNTHPRPPEAMQLSMLRPGPTRPLSLLPQLPLSGSTRGSARQGGGPEDPRIPTEVTGKGLHTACWDGPQHLPPHFPDPHEAHSKGSGYTRIFLSLFTC